MFAKLKAIIESSDSDSSIVSQVAGLLHEENVSEYKTSIGYVDDAIKNIERALLDNETDLAGWVTAVESGEGVQPRMIDLRSKPVVIESIKVQLQGMKDLKEELEKELDFLVSEETTH